MDAGAGARARENDNRGVDIDQDGKCVVPGCGQQVDISCDRCNKYICFDHTNYECCSPIDPPTEA